MPRKQNSSQTSGPCAVDLKKTSVLELDGNQYRLVYDFGAIAAAESVAGCNLLRALFNLTDLSGVELRGLLLGALAPLNADVTIDEVTAMIRVDTIEAITRAIAEAYALSIPEKAAA